MDLNELGVLNTSEKYFCTPSDLAKKMLYYTTRCGHYFCNKDYTYSYNTPAGRSSSRQNFLLFYIISGSLTISYGGRIQRMTTGQIALIDCHLPHEYWSGGVLEFLWIHFDGQNAKQFYQEITETRGNIFSIVENDMIYSLLANIFSTCKVDALVVSEVERFQLLYHILCELLIPMTGPYLHKMNTTVAHAITYIENHLFDDISVDAIAEHMNISASHLSRLFRSWTGCSPYEYVVLGRINHAKKILCTTTLSVKEIAFIVGYNSEAHFITSFTSKVGLSPGNFRRKN